MAGCSREWPGWSRFEPPDQSFSVALPGTPQFDERTVDHPRGPITMSRYAVDRSAGGFFWVITYDLPAGTSALAESQMVLRDAQQQLVASAGGELVHEGVESLRGNPGRSVEISIGDDRVAGGGVMRARIYIIGQRLYQLVAAAPAGEQGAVESEHFFTSFQPRAT
jgi:hypothetical protein